MSKILFLPDMEEGHIFPSFGLMNKLQNHGHEVLFLGNPDIIKYPKAEGFECRTIFEDIYPEGYQNTVRKALATNQQVQRKHLIPMLNGVLDEIIETEAPDILMVSFFLPLEALIIKYRYPDIPLVIFQTFFRDPDQGPFQQVINSIMELTGDEPEFMLELLQSVQEMGIQYQSLEDLAAPLKNVLEVLPCPKEFDSLHEDRGPNFIYAGAGMGQNQKQESQKAFPVTGKKVILVSLGSQISSYAKNVTSVFEKIISLMDNPWFKDFEMIVTIGREIEVDSFKNVPENVQIHNWIPQRQLLEKAELAIIHGGLGTIKECINCKVPMIVLPMGRDQYKNAERITKLNIGDAINVNELATNQIEKTAKEILLSTGIADNLLKMHELFKEKDQSDPIAALIKEIVV